MKAAYFEQFGGPEVLKYGDLPDPAAAPGEIVVNVAAASVNAADWKFRAGEYARHSQSKFPLVPGRDFSGVVGSVGEGVGDLKVGDAVFGVLAGGQEGACAEKVAVKAQVHTMGGFSAHAGQKDLLGWFSAIAASKPRVILTHGENGPRRELAKQLQERFQSASELPNLFDVVEL